jgi:hypothetical protein
MGCPKMSARSYQPTWRNIPEERRSQIYCGGSVKSSIKSAVLKKIYIYGTKIVVLWHVKMFNLEQA